LVGRTWRKWMLAPCAGCDFISRNRTPCRCKTGPSALWNVRRKCPPQPARSARRTCKTGGCEHQCIGQFISCIRPRPNRIRGTIRVEVLALRGADRTGCGNRARNSNTGVRSDAALQDGPDMCSNARPDNRLAASSSRWYPLQCRRNGTPTRGSDDDTVLRNRLTRQQ
jgi:hypothetical protein